jgi:acyl-coenzyme A synthetase/AMP-(fatty) acid ligase
VVDDDLPVEMGDEGELVVTGGSVMQGYWNMPERSEVSFLTDAEGVRWYRTGDLVRETAEDGNVFVGRRDRMVKRRGYRVELGEIEAALYRHPLVTEAAVISVPDEINGVLIKSFLSTSSTERPSLVQMKMFCVEQLPAYMIPDRFVFAERLPKTSTDKIDYQKLKDLA